VLPRLAVLGLAATLCLAQPELHWGERTDNLRVGIHADPEHDTLTIAVENQTADQLDYAFDQPGEGQPPRVLVYVSTRSPQGVETRLRLIQPQSARTSVDAHDTLRWEFRLSNLGYQEREQWTRLPALLAAGHSIVAYAVLDQEERASSEQSPPKP
jgi:hypothetical protein